MFWLAKIFTYTFLSPGLFLALLILALIAIFRDYRRGSIFLVTLAVCSIYLLSFKPARDIIIYPLENRYRSNPAAEIDALIVLGGGLRHNTRDAPGGAAPSDSTLRRLHHAYRIYRQKNISIIVCGGAPLGRAVNEGAVMARTLEQLGVPSVKIHQENLSRNTKENLLNVKTYLQKQGYRRPGIVTSAAHIPRAMRTAASFGINAVPLACDYKYESGGYRWHDIFPDSSYLRDSFLGLKEYIGLLYYQKLLLKRR
ncbi:MAG: YdcF family protein [Candidatus Margulisbacteria bacterium]|jgi:uncharacterized SAM-binding protein YcdF (DUF218 family)|nr:YdcF family protein [Candidatus Margulisiibacteriota bacterium]